MFLRTEIHWIWGCVGSWEEGPAGAGGVSGAAGETAGAQDKELFWPEWVDRHLYYKPHILYLQHIWLLSMNVPGRAEIRVDAIRSKLIPTPSLDLKSRPGEKTKQQPLKKIVWDKQEQAWIELSKTLKAGVETSAIGLVSLPGNLSSF